MITYSFTKTTTLIVSIGGFGVEGGWWLAYESYFFYFHSFWEKIGQIIVLHPTPFRLGNPR